MLTPLGMGVLALALLWVNAALTAWAALREAARLHAAAPADTARLARLLLGVVVILGGAAACTTLAVWPPLFGPVSTAGGMAGLAYFLLAPPLGTALRDHARAGLPARSGGR